MKPVAGSTTHPRSDHSTTPHTRTPTATHPTERVAVRPPPLGEDDTAPAVVIAANASNP